MERVVFAEEDEMAFSPQNEQWIRDEIDKAIREAINPLGRTKKLLLTLKDWGLTALIWTIPLGLLAVAVTLGIRVHSDGRDDATFKTRTEDKLKAIEDGLKDIRDGIKAINTRLDLRDQAGLNIQKFNHALPAVAAAIKSADGLDVDAPEDLKDSLQQQLLRADPRAPGYWPAVAQFVSYRSRQEAPPSQIG